MKKVFIQIRQWILKHRKRLIYGALAFVVVQICFFNLDGIGIENEVFADDTGGQEETIEQKAVKKVETFSFIQKIIYILIYPMLVVAGTLVDNSMVYGEALNFDIVLWELWNIMRNLAMFTLGFIFIYKIFKYLIGDQKSGEIKKLLISMLIAGVGIQASWFVMAALIDMSTILTYSVGGLPLTVLKSNSNGSSQSSGQVGNGGGGGTSSEGHCGDKNSQTRYNPYVYKTLITVDVDDMNVVRRYLTNTTGEHIYISECATFHKTGAREILLAPSAIYYSYWDGNNSSGSGRVVKATEADLCHFGGQVYQFKSTQVTRLTCSDLSGCQAEQKKYNSNIENTISNLRSMSGDDLKTLIQAGGLLEQGNAHITGGMRGALWTGQYSSCDVGLDVDNEIVGSRTKTQRLQDTLNDESYVGVFTLLYTSLMHSGQHIIGSTSGQSRFMRMLSVVLELGHLIAISIPLIVVGIIFMIRIGILWIAIIISPFIAIMTAFEDDIGKPITDKIKFLEKFKLTNLLGIIFSPAIICMAISLSTVFIDIINNVDFSGAAGEGNEILGGLIKINIEGAAANIWSILKAIIGAAITWYILWAAIQSSKLGEMKFVDDLKKLAEKSVGSLPIIPIPTKDGGVDFIGANTAFGLNGSDGIITQITNQLKNTYNAQEGQAVKDWFNKEESEEKAKKDRAVEYGKRLGSMNVPEHGKWTEQLVTIGEKGQTQIRFSDTEQLDDAGRVSIIGKFNEIDEGLRQKWGQDVPKIDIGGKTYKFRTTATNSKGEEVTVNKYMTDAEFDQKYPSNPPTESKSGEGGTSSGQGGNQSSGSTQPSGQGSSQS